MENQPTTIPIQMRDVCGYFNSIAIAGRIMNNEHYCSCTAIYAMFKAQTNKTEEDANNCRIAAGWMVLTAASGSL